jgi:hypothetical protein
MNLLDLPPHAQFLFGERGGAPVLVAYVNTELFSFDLEGNAIAAPVTLPLVGGVLYAGAGLALVLRGSRSILVDLASGAAIEQLEPLQGAAISPGGSRIALAWGKPCEMDGLSVRSPTNAGERGYPPPIPRDARPLWVSDDLNDDREWHLLYSSGARIARYSYFDDESRVIVERRHGEHTIRVAADGSVIACEGSKTIHFISGEDGRLLLESKRRAFAVGPGGRIAVSEPRKVLRIVGPSGVSTTNLDVDWLAYSLDGACLAWGGRGAFGVLRTG